jgi:hypothetical protein
MCAAHTKRIARVFFVFFVSLFFFFRRRPQACLTSAPGEPAPRRYRGSRLGIEQGSFYECRGLLKQSEI